MNRQLIILAAGKGSRMNSDIPKVMHEVGGIPMLERVISNCKQVTDDLVLVYSEHLKPYLPNFKDRCKLIHQKKQLGTAHATAMAKNLFDPEQLIGVIYGDNPLITPNIINGLFEHLQKTGSKAATLAFEYDKPNQYGRIVVDENGNFKRIVETRFANDQEKKITLCNSGIMAFAPGILDKYIDECLIVDPETSAKELYLTEIIKICASHGEKVSYFKSADHNLVVGVNTQNELANVNSLIDKD